LSEKALTRIDAVYDFADDMQDRELIDIARDGAISENERERFAHVVERIRAINRRCNRAGVGAAGRRVR